MHSSEGGKHFFAAKTVKLQANAMLAGSVEQKNGRNQAPTSGQKQYHYGYIHILYHT